MLEYLLGYPLSYYRESDWGFQSGWPLTWYWIALGLAALLITLSLFRARSNSSSIKLISIGVLQLMLVASALLLLWRPALLSERLIPDQNSIALMLDVSNSMANLNNNVSRISTAVEVLESDDISQLDSMFKVSRHTFSDEVSTQENYSDLPPPGKRTEIAEALSRVLQQAQTESLSSVILLSDGAESEGAITAEELNEIASFGVPVHTVGVGRESIEEDLELSSLTLPEEVLPNSRVTAELSIRHDAAGKVRLKVNSDNEFLTSKDIELLTDGPMTNTSIEFDIGKSGIRELEFRLDPLEDEQNIINNQQTRLLRVEDKTYRVLYIEGEPRWEYKFIRRALEQDPTLELNTILWLSESKFYRQGITTADQLADGFPDSTEELYHYDAVIIGSLNAPKLSNEQQTMLRDFVSERGGSLLMLGGRYGLSQGGWGNSLLSDVLPATLSDESDSYQRTRVQAILTAQGASSSAFQFSQNPEENRQLWNDLPELNDFQELGALRPAATTWLTIKQGSQTTPLLVSHPWGRGKSAILASAGTWRWQMGLPADDNSHSTFWRQLLRSLVATSAGQFDFSTKLEKDGVSLRAQVLNEKFEAADNVRVNVLINSNDPQQASGNTVELVALQDEPGVYVANYATPETGVWNFEAIASRDGEPLHNARSALLLGGDNAEFFNIRQDKNQLQRLADATGGKFWAAEDIDGLREDLNNSSTGIKEQTIRPLWYVPLVFLWLALLKTIEWLFRRRWGQI